MNARYLHVLMRHSDKVEIACRSNMANSYCGAIYETAPGGYGVLKRPSYYVMQLYARHAKPIALALEQPKDGPDLLACSSADKSSLTIFAVNDRSEPVRWSFGFQGFDRTMHVSGAEVVCDVLHARQPDLMNHWNTPERVKIMVLTPTGDGFTFPAFSATALECR